MMSNRCKKILVVDDEQKIVDVIKSYLLHDGYEVYEALDGTQALKLFSQIAPSLVVLDLMLPDMAGEEICRTLRKQSGVPILMLTAKVEEEDILNGLGIGADDYMTKPFSPRELAARVTALLRRASADPVPLANVLSFCDDDLVIDTLGHDVKKDGSSAGLTPIEFKILMALVRYPNKTFTRDELIHMALGDDYEGFDRTIDTHIKNLRQKIETTPGKPQYIITVHGIGYRFGGEGKV